MILGRVVGPVVATQQHAFYRGRKQLLVRFVKPDGTDDGERYIVALDQVGAGPGELVLVQDEGNSSRQMLATGPSGPIRSVIVGIVDDITVQGTP